MEREPESRCRGITRAGTRCKNPTLPGEKYCRAHLWQGRFVDARRVEFWGLVVAVVALLFTIVDATTGVVGVWPRGTPTPVPTPLAFDPAGEARKSLNTAAGRINRGARNEDAHGRETVGVVVVGC